MPVPRVDLPRLQAELEAATLVMAAKDQIHRAACMLDDEGEIETARLGCMRATAIMLQARREVMQWKVWRPGQ